LRRIARILFDAFEDVQSGRSERHTNGRILKLILFGTHAQGDELDERESGYCAAYELLIVVNKRIFAGRDEYWDGATERLEREWMLTGRLSTPVRLMVLSIMELNDELAHGRSFFVDIVRQGLTLYELPGYPLASPQMIAADNLLEEGRQSFDDRFLGAARRFDLAKESVARGYGNEAAFDLHQTIERLYLCLMDVMTLHSPKSHRLEVLRAHAERIEPRLIDVWPRQCVWPTLFRAH
jgi:hypothetical protein